MPPSTIDSRHVHAEFASPRRTRQVRPDGPHTRDPRAQTGELGRDGGRGCSAIELAHPRLEAPRDPCRLQQPQPVLGTCCAHASNSATRFSTDAISFSSPAISSSTSAANWFPVSFERIGSNAIETPNSWR